MLPILIRPKTRRLKEVKEIAEEKSRQATGHLPESVRRQRQPGPAEPVPAPGADQ